MRSRARILRELDRTSEEARVRGRIAELKEVADEGEVESVLAGKRFIEERKAEEEEKRRATAKAKRRGEIARQEALSDALASHIARGEKELQRYRNQKAEIDQQIQNLLKTQGDEVNRA